METYCFHHNDLDGILAGGIVLQRYPDAKLIPIGYSDTYTQYDLSDALVIVVDFSFPNMWALKDACKELIWIDHHKTAFDTQRRAWISPMGSGISGYRSLDFSGCMLTYAYFENIPLRDIKLDISEGLIPEALVYVDKYDLWQFKQNDVVDAFCAAAYLVWQKPEDIPYNTFFIDDSANNKAVCDYVEKGKLLLKAADNRIKYLTSREESRIVTTPSGKMIKIMFINATCDISKLGSYINTDCNCDIAAIYEITKNNIHVHLRSRVYNVEPIARAFRGGGHRGAASYSIKDSVDDARDKLFAVIFQLDTLIR